MPARPEHFKELKDLMMRQTGGDETRARRRTLTFGLLWSLDGGESPEMLMDLLALLQFELSIRRAEGR